MKLWVVEGCEVDHLVQCYREVKNHSLAKHLYSYVLLILSVFESSQFTYRMKSQTPNSWISMRHTCS